MIRYLLFIFVGVIITLSLLVNRIAPKHNVTATNNVQIMIGDTSISATLARTPQELQKGLGYISNLPENQGMLFVMNSFSYHPFWMKGMEFPLDFVWIAGNKIVDLTENVPVSKTSNPPIIRPSKICNYVLEVNAGFVKKHKVKIGQLITLRTQ